MKEEEFNKYIDGLIAQGLIRECQQDDADFEAAMKVISDEDFDSIVMEPSIKEAETTCAMEDAIMCADASAPKMNMCMKCTMASGDEDDSTIEPPGMSLDSGKHTRRRLYIVIAIAIAIAAVIAALMLLL